MTTDPTPLQESIARALDPYAWEKRDEWSSADHPNYPLLDNLVAVSMQQAAAVLPLIAAEVRKAQADALRDAADSVHDNAASPYCLPCHRDDADLLRTIAATIEQED